MKICYFLYANLKLYMLKFNSRTFLLAANFLLFSPAERVRKNFYRIGTLSLSVIFHLFLQSVCLVLVKFFHLFLACFVVSNHLKGNFVLIFFLVLLRIINLNVCHNKSRYFELLYEGTLVNFDDIPLLFQFLFHLKSTIGMLTFFIN